MLEKYEEFTSKKKAIDAKISGLKKQKLQVKLDKFNKQRQEIARKMNTNVAGPSNY
jgi:uncharacterized protein YdcH (DUF465 family)